VNELALFAGAGGGILGGVLLGWRTVCAVEHDRYCIAVLAQRQNDGVLPPFPIWDDVRTFIGGPWSGHIDVVSAGFPCQPFSVAGKKLADADARNMWPDTVRIIREVRPRFAFLENVPGLLSATGVDGKRYFSRILGDLAEAGYDAEWTVLGADDCGAPHRRKRLWILAHANGNPADERRDGNAVRSNSGAIPARRNSPHPKNARANSSDRDSDVAYADGTGRKKYGGAEPVQPEQPAAERGGDRGWWQRDPADADGESPDGTTEPWCQRRFGLTESGLGRVAHGVADRVDRLRALGNGQVPIVAATAWRLLYGRMMKHD
jgi:DNA (cytosine-5)-methyltransferase 1